MGFNSRFTTGPAVAKPPVTKPFVQSVDESKVEEHTLLRSSDRSRQSGALHTDVSRVSSSKILKLGKERSVVAAGGILVLLFSAFPEVLPSGVIGRSTILLGTVL